MTLEYKVVTGSSAVEFSEDISHYLQQGWTLHGNLTFAGIAGSAAGYYHYAQAMTREVAQRGPHS